MLKGKMSSEMLSLAFFFAKPVSFLNVRSLAVVYLCSEKSLSLKFCVLSTSLAMCHHISQ